MTLEIFKKSLADTAPPQQASVYLQALWHDAAGDWHKSHNTIQDVEDADAAWVHAYLHRKEGDAFNADYWYRRAGKKRPAISLQQEWEEIVSAML